MNKKIIEKAAIITGITGFIGRNLAVELIKKNWKIYAIVRAHSNIADLPEFVKKNVGFYEISTTGDNLPSILAAVKNNTFNPIVFHLASLYISHHQYEDITPLINSNLLFGTHILEAMIGVGLYRFINVGTAWQHNQTTDYCPINLYAATKEAYLAIIRYYEEISPLKVITLELCDTYGKDDPRPKLMALLAKCAMTGEELAMSPGEQKIDLVHISDIVAAFLLAAEYLRQDMPTVTGRYAVTSGRLITLRNLVKEYESVLGKKLNITWGGRPYREREVMEPSNCGNILPNWKCNHTKILPQDKW